MEVLRLKELREHDERAAARLKARLAEQRGDLEADFNDTLLKIENKQKHELESMMSKLNNTNEDLVSEQPFFTKSLSSKKSSFMRL